MYKQFFGLRENPFNMTPDPRFMYLAEHTKEAFACLSYGIRMRQGFVLLIGEVGTGKTTLVNKLLSSLREQRVATAFVFNPRMNANELIDFIIADFGIRCEDNSKSLKLLRLNEWLLQQYRAGGSAVLVIDEAQDLSSDVLEEVRLLTNLETTTEKLLQIVLSGQPELGDLLARPELRQLRQRIALRAKTLPFNVAQTGEYVSERLRIAGAANPIFKPEAIAAVHKFSGGIPRLINLVCEHSLIEAFADQQHEVDAPTVEAAAKTLELDDSQRKLAPPPTNATRMNGGSDKEAGAMVDALIAVVKRMAMEKPRTLMAREK
jgi:general secretion pathway protein A